MSTSKRHRGFIDRGTPFTIRVNGAEVEAFPGESVLTALLAAGIGPLRQRQDGSPACAYCAMGICFDCVVAVDGMRGVRSCMTPAAPRCEVEIEP